MDKIQSYIEYYINTLFVNIDIETQEAIDAILNEQISEDRTNSIIEIEVERRERAYNVEEKANEEKAQHILDMIEYFGLDNCLQNTLFARTLLNMDFYKREELYNAVLNSEIDYVYVFEANKEILTLTNQYGFTYGHLLACSEAFKADEDHKNKRYQNINDAVLYYVNNPSLAILQTDNGETVGHCACEHRHIVHIYNSNPKLKNIKNNRGFTVQEMHDKFYANTIEPQR